MDLEEEKSFILSQPQSTQIEQPKRKRELCILFEMIG